MQKDIRKRIVFTGKSLVWALLLFSTTMLLLNWGDVRNTVNGQGITIINAQDTIIVRKAEVSTIEAAAALLNRAHSILKTISTGADVNMTR